MAEKQVESQNCRDGEPDPYIIIILTQLWTKIARKWNQNCELYVRRDEGENLFTEKKTRKEKNNKAGLFLIQYSGRCLLENQNVMRWLMNKEWKMEQNQNAADV